jgi:hypothetical protein
MDSTIHGRCLRTALATTLATLTMAGSAILGAPGAQAGRGHATPRPAPATPAGGYVWALNARFGVASPQTASYWITRLPARC